MRFRELRIPGAFAIEPDRIEDSRGFFARTYCEREFAAHGLLPLNAQSNISWNRLRGTLRGLHFQKDPHPEAKLVRCTRGQLYDVVVDLRRHQPTYLQWEAVRISAQDGVAVYLPPGCAHGFQTLCDDTEVFYQMGDFYYPELSAGVSWNDSAIGVEWPIHPPIVFDRDNSYPDLIP
jgi:dTDP-4-dehydrorhamnose 3,5-epimerase